MPKIVKNGKEYSGVPIECVTAWQPTGDPVQVAEPLMGNTDISDIGDGTITGAISAVDASLTPPSIYAELPNVNTLAQIANYPTGKDKTNLVIVGTTLVYGDGSYHANRSEIALVLMDAGINAITSQSDLARKPIYIYYR